MTPATIGAKLTTVNVIGPMAIAAAAAEPDLYVQRLPVAGVAFDIGMSAVQVERGLRAMVEAPLVPANW